MAELEILRLEPEKMTELILSGKMRPISIVSPQEKPEKGGASLGPNLERAKRIFGADFLGPQAIEKAFGIKVASSELPSIPFTEEELLKAKDLGQFLILRIGKFSNGDFLSMQNMANRLRAQFQAAGKGKILYNTDWYKDETFYTTEVPKTRWALVSKTVIPGSSGKNYLEQTQALSDLLMSGRIFGGQSYPREYKDALEEFGTKKAELAGQMADQDYYNQHWKEIAEELSELSINKLLRQTPVEVVYDLLLRFQNTNDERLLENLYTWTCRRSSDGSLVDVGAFDANDLNLNNWEPDNSADNLGVCLSR